MAKAKPNEILITQTGERKPIITGRLFSWGTHNIDGQPYKTLGVSSQLSDVKNIRVSLLPETVDVLIDGWEHLPARYRGRSLFVHARELRPGDCVRWRESRHVSGKDNWQIVEHIGRVSKVQNMENGWSIVTWAEERLAPSKWHATAMCELV